MSEQSIYCIIPISNERLTGTDEKLAQIYDDASQAAARYINESVRPPVGEVTAEELEIKIQDDFISNCKLLVFHTTK